MDLYNKYRPTVLSEMINTSPAIAAIKKAALAGNIAHAYVFHGPRGLGKTTLGMLMPYIVNCQNPKKGIPCLECENCKTIQESNASVLYEYNMSSNRGIDTIRELEEAFQEQSLIGLKKVFLLNEAEALTKDAQKAFKDPLEKLPEDTYVIITTNDISKISEYLLDRCQKYKFSAPTFDNAVKLVESVSKKEDMKLPEKEVIDIVKSTTGRYPRALLQSIQYVKDNGIENLETDVEEFKENSPIGKIISTLFFKTIYYTNGGIFPKDVMPEMKKIIDSESELVNGVESLRRTLIGYSRNLMIDPDKRSKFSEEKLKDFFFITYPLINGILLKPLMPSLENEDMINRMYLLINSMREAKKKKERTLLWFLKE